MSVAQTDPYDLDYSGADRDPLAQTRLDPDRVSGDGTLGSALLSAREDIAGTRVFSPMGDDLGSVSDVMIDAATGRVVYGVLQFGGVFGLGADYIPIPFERLRYDHSRGGYMTDLTLEDLQGAPAHDEDWRTDRDWQFRSHEHYRVRPYWE